VLGGKKPPVVASCKTAAKEVLNAIRKLNPSERDYVYGDRSPLVILDTDVVIYGAPPMSMLKEALAIPFWDED